MGMWYQFQSQHLLLKGYQVAIGAGKDSRVLFTIKCQLYWAGWGLVLYKEIEVEIMGISHSLAVEYAMCMQKVTDSLPGSSCS